MIAQTGVDNLTRVCHEGGDIWKNYIQASGFVLRYSCRFIYKGIEVVNVSDIQKVFSYLLLCRGWSISQFSSPIQMILSLSRVASYSMLESSVVKVVLSTAGSLYALSRANCLRPIWRSNRRASGDLQATFLGVAIILSLITEHSNPPSPFTLSRLIIANYNLKPLT